MVTAAFEGSALARSPRPRTTVEKCAACNGTGKNAKGRDCSACAGTGVATDWH